jgi:hypothetical protein
MVRNLLILSLKVALHVDDVIYFVCFACMQHACDPTNATIFSFERMPTSTSLFPFCSLHGRCDDLFSIATTMHNHTPRQPTAPSSSWLCQPKDSNGLFAWLISHQPAVLFSHNKPATSNQPAVLFSQNKPAPAISHQPNEQAAKQCRGKQR